MFCQKVKNMFIKNVVIDYRDRPDGSVSKLNTYSDGLKVLKTIVKLYKDYKPLGFFSILTVVLTLLSVAFFIPVLVEYLKTGLVLRFPTLIVCGFVILAAIQSFFAGLMLSNMAQKNRRDFELRLIEIFEKEQELIEGQKE